MAWIITKHELTNTTDKWLLVGNYDRIISSHTTRERAVAAHNSIGHAGSDGLAETPWTRLDVIAPGETVKGELAQAVADYDTEDDDAGRRLLAEMFGQDASAL